MVQGGIKFGRSTSVSEFDSRMEGIRGFFRIFHVKVTKKVTNILRLGKKNVFLGFQNLEAKEIVQIAQYNHFKFLLTASFHML
jgi:hypothetical protein